MQTAAVVLRGPEQLSVEDVTLTDPSNADVVVDIRYSGISTGTERLLWNGTMPPFPGMGYPLVPGYESVGTVVEAGADTDLRRGDTVFVPGASCYTDVRGLFGGAAARLVVPAARTAPLEQMKGPESVLLALAATAYRALSGGHAPDLIIGHGVLGRLIARIAVAEGAAPVVWERNAARRSGATGYEVIDPATDTNRGYRTICDVSGDAALLDTLIGHLAPGGEIVLAGFYSDRVSFDFPPAFMREARLRISAEWKPDDLQAATALVETGILSLDGLITHTSPASDARAAYQAAFNDPDCLKMILDWSASA